MKRLLSLFILCTIQLSALYNGSPCAPKGIQEGIFFDNTFPISIDISYQKEMMFNRFMEIEGGDDFPIYSYNINSGALYIDILERVSIFGTAGAASSDLWLQSDINDLLHFISNSGFAWSVGTDILAYTYKQLVIGVSGGYQSYYTHFMSLDVNGQPVNTFSSRQLFQGWQASVTFGYQNDYVVPYIGAKYTEARTSFTNLPTLFYFDLNTFDYLSSLTAVSRIDGGLILGAAFSSGKAFSFTVEANLVSEQSLMLEGQIRF